MAIHRFINRVRDNDMGSGDEVLLFLMGLLTVAILTGVVAPVIAYTEIVMMILVLMGGGTAVVLLLGKIFLLVGRHVDVPFLANLTGHKEWQEDERAGHHSYR